MKHPNFDGSRRLLKVHKTLKPCQQNRKQLRKLENKRHNNNNNNNNNSNNNNNNNNNNYCYYYYHYYNAIVVIIANGPRCPLSFLFLGRGAAGLCSRRRSRRGRGQEAAGPPGALEIGLWGALGALGVF